MRDVFTRDIDGYVREYDIVTTAQKDLAFFLARRRNISIPQALDYVKTVTSAEGIFALKDPKVMHLRRKENGDREIVEASLIEYMDTLTDGGYIIAPNLTVYLPPKIKKSILAEYIQVNMKLRKSDKSQMFISRMRGEEEAAAYFKTMQESRKVKNNSVSGMHASPSTVGYNKSSHSSLTSMCRCATSYANSGNEKFLGGLRHYYVPNIATFHILTAAQYSNIALIEKVCTKYNIHLPTADDCMEAVLRSTIYYWHNTAHERAIWETLNSLTPYERAAFLYTGDLFHFDKHNGELVKTFLKSLATMVIGKHPDAKSQIKSLDDNYTAIASLLSAPIIGGVLLADAEKEKPEAYETVACTSENMQKVMNEYEDMIEAFFRQEYLPHSIAAFPTSRRMSVPTSDTDSTIFTTQYWVDKYGSDTPFDHECMSISYVITFLISGMTKHTLMMYSANLGVAKEQLTQLEMKNEYIFPVYVLTPLAKHYFALITAGEGNVYAEKKRILEVKGVNLRSSNAPPFVIERAREYMRWIIDSVMQNKRLTMADILRIPLEMETQIINDIKSGGFKFMNSVQIKNYESYTQGKDASAYQSYTFWNDYFADKYGAAPTPPYRAIKVSVNLPNKTAVQSWLDGIGDITIKRGMERWVEENQKSNVKLFRLPRPVLASTGIPKEIIPIIDTRGIVLEVMKPFYIILESMGIYLNNKNATRILTDECSLPELPEPDAVIL